MGIPYQQQDQHLDYSLLDKIRSGSGHAGGVLGPEQEQLNNLRMLEHKQQDFVDQHRCYNETKFQDHVSIYNTFRTDGWKISTEMGGSILDHKRQR